MTNRLATAQSLYLRKHAENPIDWHPWGPEALETAKREDKPIFLSVGYSSCHWCTVMEGEAFSEESIAAYLNANFLPIKVDREERPDLDSIYMTALQAMTGQGGWPMNMFLTPGDLVPFYGGTYFPVDPRYGRPGFLSVLEALRGFYDSDKEKLAQQTQKLMGYLRNTTVLSSTDTLNPELLDQGLQVCASILTRSSSGPSFPMMPYALLSLQGSRFQSLAEAPTLQRGLDLALGGIFDHVAGGFHRYTVDETWTVPHFEKMLYDNGQIVEYLANLWSAGNREPSFERAIALTVQWLTREMTAPEGYFYAAQDADNFVTPADPEPEEGRFYVWSASELEALLEPEEWDALKANFDLQSNGNFEQGLSVLQRLQPDPFSDRVERALAKLFQVRYGQRPENCPTFAPARNNAEAKQTAWSGRIPPVTDTKAIVSWNSLMISGLARAAAVFAEPKYLALAAQAAQFILTHQWQGDRSAPGVRLHRIYYEGTVAIPAQSEDYAFLIKALINLHQASLALDEVEAAKGYLASALKVQEEFDTYLWAIEGGGYFNAPSDNASDLILRERSWVDNATPSANGVAIVNLIRLAFLSEDLTHLDRAEHALKAFGVLLESSPTSCPSLFAAMDWYRHATVVQTQPHRIREWSTKFYWPTVLFLPTESVPNDAMGLVCKGTTCLPPVQTEAAFIEQIRKCQNRS
jgi:uncharacterized protein